MHLHVHLHRTTDSGTSEGARKAAATRRAYGGVRSYQELGAGERKALINKLEKLPTEQDYLGPSIHPKHLGFKHDPDFGGVGGPPKPRTTKQLPIDSLIAVQGFTPKIVQHYMEHPTTPAKLPGQDPDEAPIWAVEHQGKHYIQNGHHRLAALKMLGHTHVNIPVQKLED